MGVHITIEYMIMVPVLIMQIFLFPFAATVVMNTWTDQHRSLELQEIAGHLSSSIQQLYFTVNRASDGSSSLTATLDTPQTIDNHYYNITLQDISNPSSSAKLMSITLSLIGAQGESSSICTLGSNAAWQDGATFRSNVTSISATENSGLIWLSFEGGVT
jgi:hypothetical protein